ncbi:regulatory protein RecX [Bdellovibrio sp. HCB337]|uniref:regulatory protein RecX n=1 Tax=Bdellovibrio sp. HCB337 TaxID=3394358 RepID=UPI0039A5A381
MSDKPQTAYSHKSYAKKKVMDLVASRDHSEKELRTKLRTYFKRNLSFRKKLAKEQNREFTEDTPENQAEIEAAIENAIEFAKDNNWLGEPEILSEKMAKVLHRKNKGISYINNKLKEKGLPPVASDRDLELEKALALVKNKYSDFAALSWEDKRKEQARVARFLAARGFDSEIVRKVIYEEL